MKNKYKSNKDYKLTITISKDIIVKGSEVEEYVKKIKEKYEKANQEYYYWVKEIK